MLRQILANILRRAVPILGEEMWLAGRPMYVNSVTVSVSGAAGTRVEITLGEYRERRRN